MTLHQTKHALSSFPARLRRFYRANGVGGMLRKAADRLSPRGRAYRQRKGEEDRAFDAAGYDTGGIQRIYGLALAAEQAAAAGRNHIAVSPDEFTSAMAALDIDIAGFIFVDLGSGKGRALLLAADRPFARVIGVEFALELNQIAQINVERRAELHPDGPPIVTIHGDAARFEFPDEPTVLFLFNSFGPPVLTRVIDNALASWRRSPRPFRVIYLNPVHLEAWTQGGWRLIRAGDGMAIYGPPEGE